MHTEPSSSRRASREIVTIFTTKNVEDQYINLNQLRISQTLTYKIA